MGIAQDALSGIGFAHIVLTPLPHIDTFTNTPGPSGRGRIAGVCEDATVEGQVLHSGHCGTHTVVRIDAVDDVICHVTTRESSRTVLDTDRRVLELWISELSRTSTDTPDRQVRISSDWDEMNGRLF